MEWLRGCMLQFVWLSHIACVIRRATWLILYPAYSHGGMFFMLWIR